MFEDFFSKCKLHDEAKPSKKRVNKNIAAVRSLIDSETEGNTMTKRKIRIKPLIIAAAVIIASAVSLLTVNAASGGNLIKFIMGGEEIEGGYRDYVDHDGYRHVSFEATLPIYEENYAIIFDVDASNEEAVRVITDETNPDFIDRLHQYLAARDKASEVSREMWAKIYAWKGRDMRYDEWDERDRARQEALEAGVFKEEEWTKLPAPEDFGLVFKDSELCSYSLGYVTKDSGFYLRDGYLGGKFMSMGAAEGHPSGCGSPDDDPRDGHYDWESETKTKLVTFYYYVGKE